jgi:hypothetical protein
MSIVSWVTSILRLVKIPDIDASRDENKQSTRDDGEHLRWNDEHKGRENYSKHDSGWKNANDDGQLQKDFHDPKLSDGENYRSAGDALAKFDFSRGDFSQGDFGSHGPDHSGDIEVALASMSSDDALEYAIGQMGPADHFDVGHFDVPSDISHDTDA